MADNVIAPTSDAGGPTFASDDIGGVQYPRAKVVWGADGAANDTAAAAPLPARLYTAAGAETGVAANPLQATLIALDPAVVALQIIDDWDESDRAKVNVIAGQAGITAGAGAVAANTPRVTHASDDPSVTVLGAVADAAATAGGTGSVSAKLRNATSLLDAIKTAVELLDDTVDGTELRVDIITSALPTGAATDAKLDTLISQTDGVEGLLTTIDTDIGTLVDTAHSDVDAGNPVKIGAKAENALSGITLVTDGDRTQLHADLDGVLVTRLDTTLADVVQERVENTDGNSTAFASGLAAPGANIRLWIKTVTIANSSASFVTVDLRDGAAGSVLWTFPVPATGGVTHNFDPPLRVSVNTALAYDASAGVSTLTISANGFKSKV